MNTAYPSAARLKEHLKARAVFLQTTRDRELREVSADDAVANILAVDGFVSVTSATQTERHDTGMQEQQRLFRLMPRVAHG